MRRLESHKLDYDSFQPNDAENDSLTVSLRVSQSRSLQRPSRQHVILQRHSKPSLSTAALTFPTHSFQNAQHVDVLLLVAALTLFDQAPSQSSLYSFFLLF
jgi:hypothetical protein